MAAKYDPLRRHLESRPDDEPVSLTMAEVDQMVGGLPPSSAGRTWWANTVVSSHAQAAAWMGAGRRVVEVRVGQVVVFSPSDGPAGASPTRGSGPSTSGRTWGRTPVMDGVASLHDTLERAGYGSILEAVCRHTRFLHPRTVEQTGGQPLFPVIRNPNRRGEIVSLEDGRQVMFDDNTTPTLAFLWAAARSKGRDVQCNHLWGDPRNPDTYTALWNLCVTPAFLAKTTDGSNHPTVLAALRYRAADLYGHWPEGEKRPRAPEEYPRLAWLDPLDPVDALEGELRRRLASAPASPPAKAARRLGWLFSGWTPDPTVGTSGR